MVCKMMFMGRVHRVFVTVRVVARCTPWRERIRRGGARAPVMGSARFPRRPLWAWWTCRWPWRRTAPMRGVPASGPSTFSTRLWRWRRGSTRWSWTSSPTGTGWLFCGQNHGLREKKKRDMKNVYGVLVLVQGAREKHTRRGQRNNHGRFVFVATNKLARQLRTSSLLDARLAVLVGQRHFHLSHGRTEFLGQVDPEFVGAQEVVDPVQHPEGRVSPDGLLVVIAIGDLRWRVERKKSKIKKRNHT